MEAIAKTKITVSTTVNVPVEIAWQLWTMPSHIMQWNNASPDWHTPKATNDFIEGGTFVYRMEARDGSFGFDFTGVYDAIKTHQYIKYTIADGRPVEIIFQEQKGATHIIQTFEAEQEHSAEMQQQGWQAIMDTFKNYADKL